MRNFWLAALMLIAGVCAKAQQFEVSLSGNGYVTENREGAEITKTGLADWTDPKSVTSVYFSLQEAAKPEISLLAKGHSEIKVSYGKKSFKVKLNSDNLVKVPVGKIDVKQPGYVQLDIQGISKKGETFGEIKNIIVDNVTCGTNYVHDFEDYWARRGPSVHLAYQQPEGDTEWFYNEVTVPEDGEVMSTYYMVDGFREGYFGMQYNSPTKRLVLFSVWSPFVTDNPNEIPEDKRVKLLRRGKDVHIGEFGDEGSGGQSYLNYPWKAGETYKFLTQVKPDGNGNTIYTAYFFATEENEWRLIASFLRPETDTWYQGAHSFLENFVPEQGYLTRRVMFGNQWARSKEGKWTRINDASFSHDGTAAARVRLDFKGGETDDNRYYLQMGGFFNDWIPYGTKFHTEPTGTAPVIDWEALKKL